MAKLFKVADETNMGDNWFICHTGHEDGHDYFVTTDHVHASEYSEYSLCAKGDAELIVGLLNWYYNLEPGEQRQIDKTGGAAMTTCTYCNLPIKPGREDPRNPNIHGDWVGCASALKCRVAELENIAEAANKAISFLDAQEAPLTQTAED